MAVLDLPPNPSLKDMQLPWEAQFWYKSRQNWKMRAAWLEEFRKFLGDDRRPRDVFRSDIQEYITWLRKRGKTDPQIHARIEVGRRFYRFLGELELVEQDFNPFVSIGPRRIRIE